VTSKDRYRAAPGNEIPLPWPLDTTESSEEARQIVASLESVYRKVLTDSGINLHQVRVQGLSPRTDFRPRDTMIIETHDENSEGWKAAATEIQELLDNAIRKRKLQDAGLKIRVEIWNEVKMHRDTSSIIKPNTTIHKALESIQEIVYKGVKENCSGMWTSISYHMRGPRWQEENRTPTIVVSIAPGSRGLWATVEENIRSAVEDADSSKSFDIDLAIELLPGAVLDL